MAGHGGGAWKVAYADFVTAMMAFFMVMWITAQNKQMKMAVAHYFNDPFNSMSKTKGPESVYFCQPGLHRSPHRPSVDTIYFDNFILADTLEDVVK